MQKINLHTVDALKGKELYFIAGALARALEQPRVYGPHINLKSELDFARNRFYAGYDAGYDAPNC
jgi:hypothetical protein